MGTGEFPAPQAVSIPMRYAVLLRDLRLSVPVFDDSFNAEEFSAILGALKGLQVRMVNFEHNLDKLELGVNKLEHHIEKMELHMQQLHSDLDLDPDYSPSASASAAQQHFYLEDCPPAPNVPDSDASALLALEPP